MLDNIGFSELVFIILIILVFFGPHKIPEIARSFGKIINQARKAFTDIEHEVKSENEKEINNLENNKNDDSPKN